MLETGYDMETADTRRFYISVQGDPQIAHPSQRDWHQESRRSYPNYDEGLAGL